jgi:hypothetical protein
MEGMLSPDELADPERTFNRLLFAAQDMGECRDAVDLLLERDEIPGNVQRALETGAVVAYARPWTKGSIGVLGDHWLPADPKQRALHDALRSDRNKVYAHTDEEAKARWVHGVQWNEGALQKPTMILPMWRPRTLDQLPQIRELADAQMQRFAAGIMELVRQA